MQDYGSGYFILKTGSTSFLTGQSHNNTVDLSDKEVITIETEAIDGTLHAKVKGTRINPVVTIFNPTTDIQTTLNTKKGTTVNFTPYNDNSAWNWNCILIEAEPEFYENTAVIKNIVIKMKSVGYTNFIAKA